MGACIGCMHVFMCRMYSCIYVWDVCMYLYVGCMYVFMCGMYACVHLWMYACSDVCIESMHAFVWRMYACMYMSVYVTRFTRGRTEYSRFTDDAHNHQLTLNNFHVTHINKHTDATQG